LDKNVNLDLLSRENKIEKRRGIGRGKIRREDSEIMGRRILEETEFPANTFLYIDSDALIINNSNYSDVVI